MLTDEFLYADENNRQKWIDYIKNSVVGLAQRAKLEEDDQQGLLVDPNLPVTPEPPEPMPQQPQMPGQPVDAAQMPAMPQMGDIQAPQAPQDAGVLNSLLGGGNEQPEPFV